MGIYTRDNINYGGMLANALQSKSNYLKNRYDRVAQMGKNWGDAIANSGKVAQDAIFKLDDQYYNQDKIEQQQKFQASEAEKSALRAMQRQKEQEDFQKLQNELNRKNTYNIALLNKETVAADKELERAKAIDKAKLEAELAQAEYDDAVSRVDIDKPETVLAARKAAFKLNYANSNLPYYANNPQVFTVPTDFTEDAPQVAIAKKVNNAIQILNPIIAAPQKQWTNEQKQAYADAFAIIKQYKPELITKYQIEETKKGETNEVVTAQAKALKAKAQASYDTLPKLSNGTVRPGAFARWKEANPKYAKVLGL